MSMFERKQKRSHTFSDEADRQHMKNMSRAIAAREDFIARLLPFDSLQICQACGSIASHIEATQKEFYFSGSCDYEFSGGASAPSVDYLAVACPICGQKMKPKMRRDHQ